MERINVDVVVVGAGLAGLSAATKLVAHGLSVMVLEASSRVGGRTRTVELASGDVIDRGGQWVGESQTSILRLARELGIETFPSPREGKNLLNYQGQRLTYGDGLPPLGLLGRLDLIRTVLWLDRLAKKVPLEAPWRAERADALDSLTVAAWLGQMRCSAAARFMITTVSRLNLGVEPKNVSLLYFLFKIHSAGGFKELTAGGVAARFIPGSQPISDALAAKLGPRVRLDAPVVELRYRDDAVTAACRDFEVDAKRALIAMDPAVSAGIKATPDLPKARRTLAKRWTMARGMKIHCVYARPFWRDAGLSGQALFDTGPIAGVFDNSRPHSERGVLVLFGPLADHPALAGLDGAARQRALLDILAGQFGEAARDPIAYDEQDWNREPFVGGCVSYPAPGVLTTCGEALRAPIGPVFFASAETAVVWEGHMEGAIRSGEKAGGDIAASLLPRP